MKKLINLLRGYVEWNISGAFPERMLNLCAQHRLQFWRMRWVDSTTFTFRTALHDRKRVMELAQKAMCEPKVLAKRGMGAAALALVGRWGFLLGLALCLGAVSILSRFLLVVEVSGNETVPTAVILSELQRLGVRPGAYGPDVEVREVANEALIALPQLSYMAINIYGTRAAVQVREAVKSPELLEEKIPADVVAVTDGIILDIRADSGQALVNDGDIVAKGEVLITGKMDLKEPQYSEIDLGWLQVRAAGSVRARTWRTLEESIPLAVAEKCYTGAEETLYSLKILWGQVDFFENSSISYERYDRITCTRMFTVAGREMPLGLITTTIREYTVTQAPLYVEEAEERLKQMLQRRLSDLMDANDGIVLRSDFVTRMAGDVLTVTLLAECEEEIGRTVELPGEIGRIPAGSGS